MTTRLLSPADYRTLVAFHTALTRFLHWRAEQTRIAGLTPQQHNLLLAVRAHGGSTGPSIREVAECLVLQHHTAVGLVDRAQRSGLVRRCPDTRDRRIVRVRLTPVGRRIVNELEAAHRAELQQIAPALGLIYQSLDRPLPDGRREG